jgi:hypothetical protein
MEYKINDSRVDEEYETELINRFQDLHFKESVLKGKI